MRKAGLLAVVQLLALCSYARAQLPCLAVAWSLPVPEGYAGWRCLAAADVTGDGTLDIVAGEFSEPYGVYVVDGASHTVAAWHGEAPVLDIATGDFDSDGAEEAAVARAASGIELYGAGGIEAELPLAEAMLEVEAGDIDSDGVDELAVAASGPYTGWLAVYEWSSRGFKQLWKVSFGAPCSGLKLADLAPPRGLELVLESSGVAYCVSSSGAFLWVCRLSCSSVYMTAEAGGAVAMVDGSEVYLIQDGVLRLALSVPGCMSAAIEDFDSDSELELMAGTMQGELYYLDSGVVAWSASLGSSIEEVEAGDLDGDGKLEAALVCYDGAVAVAGCNGLEALAELSGCFYSLELADIDSDGLPEVLASSPLYVLELAATLSCLRSVRGQVTVVLGEKALAADVAGATLVSHELGRASQLEVAVRLDSQLSEEELSTMSILAIGGPAVNSAASYLCQRLGVSYTAGDTFTIEAEGLKAELDLSRVGSEDICIVYISVEHGRIAGMIWGYSWRGTYAGCLYLSDSRNWGSSHLVFLRWVDLNGDGLVQAGEVHVEAEA